MAKLFTAERDIYPSHMPAQVDREDSGRTSRAGGRAERRVAVWEVALD